MMRIECPKCGATAMIDSANAGATNDDERLRYWNAPERFRKVQFGPRFERVYLYCETCGVPARPGLVSDGLLADIGENR